MIVDDFSNKKLKKLYPDFNFISHFIINKSDLKLKTSFLLCGTLLYSYAEKYKIVNFWSLNHHVSKLLYENANDSRMKCSLLVN